MKKITLLILILLIECNSKAMFNIKKINSSSSEKEFQEFYSSFPEINLPYILDSLNLIDLYENQYLLLNSLLNNEYPFFNIEEFFVKCYSVPRYEIKKFGRLKNDSENNLIFYARTNANCPSDADEGYIVLCQYNEKGELLKYKIIGRFYASFGYTMYQYFTITSINNKLHIHQHTIEEEEKIETDKWEIQEEKNDFYW